MSRIHEFTKNEINIMSENLYAERDIIQLDRDGNYYCQHVDRMTAEKLHSKSDIAAELGHRDQRIADLSKKLDQAIDRLDSTGRSLLLAEWSK